MATRGVQIGQGYVSGLGPVQIYNDLDKTSHLHCMTRRDRWYYLPRTRVQFRKPKKAVKQ